MATVTIREHFRQIQKRCVYGLVALMLALVLFIDIRYPHFPRNGFYLVGLGFVVVATGPLFIIMRRLYRCPKCDASFMKWKKPTTSFQDRLNTWNRDRRPFFERWDGCPDCGVSFDAPWPKTSDADK